MTSDDPELVRLLTQELERHLPTLETWPADDGAALRALHALKGSAGLAGERELASALERLERRAREGDDTALDAASTVVASAVARLTAGQPAVPSTWPVPPDDLAARPLDPLVRTQYALEATERLSRIDEALATGSDPVEAARAVYRHVHTIKGAASAAGDEPMSWFCHGLEERLRGLDSSEAARTALREVARWRVVLGALLEEPDTALGSLRGKTSPSPVPPVRLRPSTPPRRADSDPPHRPSGFDEGSVMLRVAASEIDRLLERVEAADRVRERIAARAEDERACATELRGLRASLVAALRLIGPPRPWGAPAAAIAELEDVARGLGALADDVEAGSSQLRGTEQVLRDGVLEAKRQLSTMRQTTLGRLFARLTTAIESEARRCGKVVIVRTRGADQPIDRRIADALVEPCMQLVRNAVAHGIEPPEERAAAGKPESGTVSLSGRRLGGRLHVVVEDDGAGVDLDEVRERAVELGAVTPGLGRAASHEQILGFLFVPGLSTRDSSDLLAGRGIGLDIARAAVQRLGGALRISTRAGLGFVARVEVPVEPGFVQALWVRAAEHEIAVPVAHAQRVRPHRAEDRAVPHLLECLTGRPAAGPARYVVELVLESDGPPDVVAIGVDAIGKQDELLVRPVGPLVTAAGPYAGAVLRGDGTLRLVLDAWGVASRVQSLPRHA